MRSLIWVVCAIALVSSSWASAAPSLGDDVRSNTIKPPGEMLVAQAWWDAAYNTAITQRQTPAQFGVPLVRSESRRYGDFSHRHTDGIGAHDLMLKTPKIHVLAADLP
jgi:hypothetical protein